MCPASTRTMRLQVKDHARQLLEKRLRAPFFDVRYGAGRQRMKPEDVTEGLAWLEDRFHLIRHEDEQLPSVEWVLSIARAAVLR